MDGLKPFHYDALVDLEAMASVEDAGFDPAIVDIGIAAAAWIRVDELVLEPIIYSARFTIDVNEYKSGSRWYRAFNTSPQCMLWWATQPAEVRKTVFGGKLELTQALRQLNNFVLGLSGTTLITEMPAAPFSIWGKPLHYDLVALRHAYRVTGVLPAWSWRQERDLSTVAYEMNVRSDAGSISHAGDPSSQKHNPEYDALRDLSIITKWRKQIGWPRYT